MVHSSLSQMGGSWTPSLPLLHILLHHHLACARMRQPWLHALVKLYALAGEADRALKVPVHVNEQECRRPQPAVPEAIQPRSRLQASSHTAYTSCTPVMAAMSSKMSTLPPTISSSSGPTWTGYLTTVLIQVLAAERSGSPVKLWC
jgi:hypothetical protein